VKPGERGRALRRYDRNGSVAALWVALSIVGIALVPAREALADPSSPSARASSPRMEPKRSSSRQDEVAPAETRAPAEPRTEPPGATDLRSHASDPPRASDAPVERDIALASPETTRSAQVVVEGVTFENGDVPRAASTLERAKKDLARCAVTDNPRDDGRERLIRLRFIVRAPGRAEGVDVVQVRDMSPDMARCVVLAMKNRFVGHPSDDPVSVELTFRLSQKLENLAKPVLPLRRGTKGRRHQHASRVRSRDGDEAGHEQSMRALEAKETEKRSGN
jgi:hypothetical protein